MAAAGQSIAVLGPLMVATAMAVVTVLVHATALIAAAWLLRGQLRSGFATIRFVTHVCLTASIALLALAAHFVEIAIAWIFAVTQQLLRTKFASLSGACRT